jgi:hypothetical protein
MTTEVKVTEEMIQQALKASGSVEIARSGAEKLSMRQGFELGMQYARHHQADDATVERVARAIYFEGGQQNEEQFQHMQRHLREQARRQAKAAIAAMPVKEESPTEKGWPILSDHMIRTANRLAGYMGAKFVPHNQTADDEMVERVAQFLHDEGGFDEAWSESATWPEHPDDTGQREGGYVRIVPSDVQAKFRDVARRLCVRFPKAAIAALREDG